MSKIPELLSSFCKPASSYRSKDQFLDELKREAKRSRKTQISIETSKPISQTQALDLAAKDLGYRDWQHIIRVPHPDRCEAEIFLTPALVSEFGTKLDWVDAPETAQCGVAGCTSKVGYRAFLFDYHESLSHVFLQPDLTCPYLCRAHAEENERKASGLRRPRSAMFYPFSNKQGKAGFNCYLPLPGHHRFSVWNWTTRGSSPEREKAFIAYIERSLEEVDFDDLDAELERYIFDRISCEVEPARDYEYDPDGTPYGFDREFDSKNLTVEWDGIAYEKNDDGSYYIYVNKEFDYVDNPASWDDPPLLHVTGQCWLKFSGRPRGSEPMTLDFVEYGGDVDSVPGIRRRKKAKAATSAPLSDL